MKSLDRILKQFHKTNRQLQNLIDANDAKADRHHEEISRRRQRINELQSEANRAQTVKSKIEDLVS